MLMMHSDLYQTLVTVYVGPDSHAFHVYKELVCYDSPFFKAALEGNFKEGDEQTVSLPEDDVGTFKIYQTWLNTTQLRYNFDQVESWLCFAKLWVFADKIGSNALKNETIDAICLTVKKNPHLDWASPQAVCYTFDNTSSISPLRNLVVNHAYHAAENSPPPSELENYPVAFVSRLTSCFLAHVKKCPNWEKSLAASKTFHFTESRYYLKRPDKSSGETPIKRQHKV